MRYLAHVIRFGWPYLRRYRVRLMLGILLGLIFGISNAGILGVTKMLLNRIFPEEPALQAGVTVDAPPGEGIRGWAYEQGQALKETVLPRIDPWLPADGRELDALQVTGILVLFPLLFAFRGYLGYLSSYCMGWVSERVINDLRLDVFKKLSSLSLNFFNRSRVGDLLTHVHGDTQSLQRTLNLGVGDLVREPITIVATFVAMLWIDWQLTLFVFVFLPLCLVPMIVLGKKARKASKGNVKTSVVHYNLLVEFVSSIRLVKAYNLEEEQTTRFGRLSRDLVHHAMKAIQARQLINPLIETIGALLNSPESDFTFMITPRRPPESTRSHRRIRGWLTKPTHHTGTLDHCFGRIGHGSFPAPPPQEVVELGCSHAAGATATACL